MLELRCYLFNLLGFLSCWSLVYLLSTYAKPQHNTPAPVEDLQPMSLPHLVNEMKMSPTEMMNPYYTNDVEEETVNEDVDKNDMFEKC